ncbi:MAG TPA: outer membrane protein assembly factor BamA, partial [Chromatiales bacterium]|nr:outer membrane protein assembly factor BamA [Chromatiales bacterium]
NVETTPVPGSPDEIDINLKVKEKPSGMLTAGVGYSQSQGFIFNTNVTQNNFFGTGKRVSFGFNNSDSNTLYRLGYHNPYYTIDGISRGFEFSYRETDFDELSTADYTTDTGVAAINFGWPLTEIDRFSFGLNYRYTKFKPGTSQLAKDFADQNGDRFDDFLLKLGWTRDSRNRALFPTRGGYQNLRLEASIPLSDLEFYKLRYRHQRYLPLSEDLTLKLGVNLGYGEGYGKTDSLPFFENYFAGGPRSVRGFKANSLGPRESSGDSDPVGGNLKVAGNIELIFPPPMEDFRKTMRISAFFDIGNVFAIGNSNSFGNQGFEASDLRYSVGLSATWMSPLGALTFSFAEPLNDEEFDDLEKFQFSLGTTF